MSILSGWQRYLHLARETDWGEPASASPLYLPFLEYSVEPKGTPVEARLFTGLRQRPHHRIARAHLAGRLAAPLYSYHVGGKSLGQTLLEWLLSAPSGPALDSYTALVGGMNHRQVGLRPDRGILAGSADRPTLTLTMDLLGKLEESASVPAVPTAPPRPTEFLFRDVEFRLDDQPRAIHSFALSVANHLEVRHGNSYWPSSITAGVRAIELAIGVFPEDDLFAQMRRAEPDGVAALLRLTGLHDGTGPPHTNATTITFTFDRLAFAQATDQGTVNEPVGQAVSFVVLKPATAHADVQVAFGTS